jgi:hypothetical protein
MPVPPPPERRLQRVLQIARGDGWILLGLAVPGGVLACFFGDAAAALAGLGVALCGALELHGRARLRQRRIVGLSWLVTAQLSCLLVLLLYVVVLGQKTDAAHLSALLPAFTREQLELLVPDPAEVPRLLLLLQRLATGLLGLGTLLGQGGLAWYYHRSRPAVRAAFAQPPLLTEP